jgi:hypothetical protein
MVICKDFTQKFPTVAAPFMSHWKDYILLPWVDTTNNIHDRSLSWLVVLLFGDVFPRDVVILKLDWY